MILYQQNEQQQQQQQTYHHQQEQQQQKIKVEIQQRENQQQQGCSLSNIRANSIQQHEVRAKTTTTNFHLSAAVSHAVVSDASTGSSNGSNNSVGEEADNTNSIDGQIHYLCKRRRELEHAAGYIKREKEFTAHMATSTLTNRDMDRESSIWQKAREILHQLNRQQVQSKECGTSTSTRLPGEKERTKRKRDIIFSNSLPDGTISTPLDEFSTAIQRSNPIHPCIDTSFVHRLSSKAYCVSQQTQSKISLQFVNIQR